MNQELKRIREKDFTSIDEKLFENLSRAQNLTSTLTHLSDFQKFLMEQISSMNHNQPASKSNLIAKSIAKNFDDLKESLVKCSRIQIKPERSLLTNTKTLINSLKYQLKQVKKSIKQQVSQVSQKNKEHFQRLMQDVLSKFQNEKYKNKQLNERCLKAQSQNLKLRQQNEKLKSCASSKLTQELKNIEINIKTDQNFRTPLKQVYSQERPSSNMQREQGWRIMRNQLAMGFSTQEEKRANSLKRQTSNHQISRKSNFKCFKDKENEAQIFKSKGVIFEDSKRGKSRQKIKLFSMI